MTIYRADISDAVMDCVPFLVADIECGTIYHASRPLEEMFGYAMHGELAGQYVDELVPLPRQSAHVEHRKAYAARPKPRLGAMGAGLILRGQHVDGHTFPVEVLLSPVVISSKKCVIAVVIDVTARQESK